MRVHGHVPGRVVTAIEDETAHYTGLSEVLAWGAQALPARAPVDVIAQDEYAHDVVLRWAPGIFVAFAVT